MPQSTQPFFKNAARMYALEHGMTFAELVRYSLQLYLDTHPTPKQ